MLLDVLKHSNLEWLRLRSIFITRHGSHAYGTNIETSDEDYKGVAVPPSKYFLGYLEHFDQAEFHHQVNGCDAVIYDIRKFFRLAVDCNPNIIEMLFTDPSDHILVTSSGKLLLKNRELFLSKKARHTFSGYVVSQLKKLKNHRRWVENPPKAPPDSTIEEWRSYQIWLKTRNPVRLDLEQKYGYDTKHAMHVVRLLQMGREILEGKGVIVKRPNAAELLEIRNGGLTYEELINWAEGQLVILDELYRSSRAVPDSPDRKRLDILCMEIVCLELAYGDLL